MRRRPVVGKATVPDAVRRLQNKFDYPDREFRPQVVPILDTLGAGGGTGAFIHLTRNATQSIASAGEEIEWDTLGLQGFSGFTETVSTTTVTIEQAGYYNIAVLLGWSSFLLGGTLTILKNGVSIWPPADDPGLWSTTNGQFFEGTAPAIDCKTGDVLSVNLNPDDASAQTLASATLAVYLVDRAVNEGLYRELILSHGPLAYWRLDEPSGATAADSAGHALGPFDGTYTSAPSLDQPGVMQDGSGNAAADFSSTAYVAGSDWTALDFLSTASFSVECWIEYQTGADGAIVTKGRGYTASDHDGWSLSIDGSNTVKFQRFDRTIENEVAGTVTAAKKHYLAATFDGTTLRFYIDGSEVDSDTTVVTINDHNVALRIARGDDDGSPSGTAGDNYDGTADEVAIYDRVLTPAEIQEHWLVGGG